MSDFTKHKDKARRKNYLERSGGIRTQRTIGRGKNFGVRETPKVFQTFIKLTNFLKFII